MIARRLSVRFKLLLTMLIITILPLMIAGYLQFENAKQAVYQFTVSDLEYITDLKKRELAPYTQDTSIFEGNRQKIKDILNELAEKYYQPNGMSGYAYIMDQEGVLLFYPDASMENTSLLEESFTQEMIANKKGWIEYLFQGDYKLAVYDELPNGWILVTASFQEDLLKPIEQSRITMFIISLVSAIGALVVGSYIIHKLLLPLKELVAAMKSAEAGDLTPRVTINSRDEFGQLSQNYNEMMDGFCSMLKDVQQVSQQVEISSEELKASASESARASEQISGSSADIATSSDQQKLTVLETGDFLQRIGHDIQEIAKSTNHVNDEASHAYQLAGMGGEKLRVLAQEMDQITEHVRGTEKVVRELGAQSEKIIGIISIIQQISEQTNLLALNAAIEAARAGEQGRSFAVVAQEVRKLAEQSGQAAEEIASLIHNVNQDIQEAVGAMSTTVGAVQEGRGGVASAGESFQQILLAVQDVSQQVDRMNGAAQAIHQETDKLLVNSSTISELAEVTARNTQEVAAASEEQTASTEEMAAAAETLAQMAKRLSEQIKRFTI